MIIQSSSVGMNSRRYYANSQSSYTSLQTWGSGQMYTNIVGSQSALTEQEESTTGDATSGNTFGDSMKDIINRFQESQRVNAPQLNTARSNFHKMQLETFDYLLRLIFGEDYDITDKSGDTAFVANANQQFGGHYESMYSYSETEYTNFQTTGTAVTADGREINFNVNFSMSRTFMEYSQTNFDFGSPQLTDPLVINLDNHAVSVSDQTFLFDIDADGTLDNISMLGKGSGYLALDKNGDGTINDGSELFGTASGNGFADLAKYDLDKNGWIDEADAVFDALRIWSKDENGNDKLVGLGSAGVGAIYLGSADTEFSLNSAKDNNTNAVVRQSGIFLYENGNVGTVQQIDLAKQFTASS